MQTCDKHKFAPTPCVMCAGEAAAEEDRKRQAQQTKAGASSRRGKKAAPADEPMDQDDALDGLTGNPVNFSERAYGGPAASFFRRALGGE